MSEQVPMIPYEVACSVVQPHAGVRRVLVDALNVAYWCGEPPSLRLPVALMAQLLAAGHEALLYFDASARYRLGEEAGLYARLSRHSRHFIEVPSGKRADVVMLKYANVSGACIVSRDQYRDYRKRYRRIIDDPARMLSGEVENDRLRVPALGIEGPLPASAEEAWVMLEPLLASEAMQPPPGEQGRVGAA